MTLSQIIEILEGNFADENDRKYWEDKKAEIERKEGIARENEKYFVKMAKYAR